MEALIIYGVSGSGKSSFARELVQEGDYTWIERDRYRFEGKLPVLFKLPEKGNWASYKPDPQFENIVDAVWKWDLLNAMLEGRQIIISDTLCNLKDRKNLHYLLTSGGYTVEWHRMSTPLTECVNRDIMRSPMSVGESVILRQWENLNKSKEHI